MNRRQSDTSKMKTASWFTLSCSSFPTVRAVNAPKAPQAKATPRRKARHSLLTLLLTMIMFAINTLNIDRTVPRYPTNLGISIYHQLLVPCNAKTIMKAIRHQYYGISIFQGDCLSDWIPTYITEGISNSAISGPAKSVKDYSCTMSSQLTKKTENITLFIRNIDANTKAS